MSWQLSVFAVLALVLISGGFWFERSRPSARIVAAVAALAALGVAGRLILAPFPNVVATTDVALITGYVLGGPPGFAVGALSALISNFWLGQGPWTPWQMAGWGMVGVGGAALATLTRHRINRWGLAAAGALAGLLYGALLDLSAMVNFGGEQSLERYLALSVRGIPFNIAHALGNAAIMLAAGPALIRIVDRYRDRFAVEWEPRAATVGSDGGRGGGLGPGARTGLASLLIAAGLGLGLLGAPAPQAGAADPEPVELRAGGDAAAAYLRGAQNDDGGYGTGPGYTSNPGMTGWAILGLEAAGINPLDVGSRGESPIDFLRADAADIDSTGDLERTIIALRGAGLSVTDFGGQNLLSELRSRQSGNGSYEKQVNLTAFAVLARAAAGDPAGELKRSTGWLREVQNKDGGWGSTPSGASEPDSTGAVLQAMDVVGASKPAGEGARWLKGAQNRDGGWALVAGSGSNSQSTAWAIQGLVAAGESPSFSKGSRSGLDYLEARTQGDGSVAYSSASEQTPVWVTAQAITALEREPFPISPVARAERGGDGGGGGGGSGGSGGDGGGGTGTGGSTGNGTSTSSTGTGTGIAADGSGPGGNPGTSDAEATSEGAADVAAGADPTAAEETPEEVIGVAAAETSAATEEDDDGGSSGTTVLLLLLGVVAAGAGASYWANRRD